MADYIWVESPGTAQQMRPRVARTSFGDGYTERAPDGLNPLRQVWQVQHTDIDDEIGDEIVAFLEARFGPTTGQETFDWVPPRQTVALRFTCSEWTRTLGSQAGKCSVTAVFVQDFQA